MKKASAYFSDSDKTMIEESVKKAESKTSCEIVPVVASSSGRYDRAEDLIGLWSVIFIFINLRFCPCFHIVGDTGWNAAPSWVCIGLEVIILLISFVIGAFIGSKISWLRNLCTPRKEMVAEVAAKSSQMFFDNRIHHTEGANGLLIYVSLHEHLAVVLADQKILAEPSLGQSFVDKLCKDLTEQLRQDGIAKALTETINAAGDQLSLSFPIQEDDKNELENTLVLID